MNEKRRREESRLEQDSQGPIAIVSSLRASVMEGDRFLFPDACFTHSHRLMRLDMVGKNKILETFGVVVAVRADREDRRYDS